MKILRTLLAIIFFLLITLMMVDCSKSTNTNIGSPRVPSDTDWCASGCAYLQTLVGGDGNPGCEQARVLEMPNGDIMTCADWCTTEQKLGRNLYPSCFKFAKKCSDIEEFRKRSEPCEGH